MLGEGRFLIQLRDVHVEVKARGYPHSEDALGNLLNRTKRKVGSGHKRTYEWADVRYAIIWHRWTVLASGSTPRSGGGRSDANMAGGIARHYSTGWVVKSGGTMFQTEKPEHYLKDGLVAVNLEIE